MRHDEQFIQSRNATICVQAFGKSSDPTILLNHGAGASMLWWEDALCTMIASHGRHVIRFDNRDTGRSTAYPPGEPGYSMNDLVLDSLAILDTFGIARAHVVGRSMAGGMAMGLAVDHPNRVASVTLASTTTGDESLPPMSDEFIRYTSKEPDFSNREAMIEYITGLMRVFSGTSPYFNENAMRKIAELDVARSTNLQSAMSNHFRMELDTPRTGGPSDIKVPTLIVHGERDPVYPLAHGIALERAIDGATMLVLPEAGHEIPAPLWPLFVDRLVRHSQGK
jgi:pimeloyl-ACP methyl ester carboxylesterase